MYLGGDNMERAVRTPYDMMKTLILANQYDRTDMLAKMDKYLKYNKITQEQYNELLALMDANEVQ